MGLAALLVLALATGSSSTLAQGVVAADESPAALGWACRLAFESAQAAIDATAPAASSLPDAEPDPARLDESMRYCISVEEWAAAAADYSVLFAETDPLELFALRCMDPESGLSAYTACHTWLLGLDPSLDSPGADGRG